LATKTPSLHLIAYIDFLGTKERIRKDTNNKHFEFLSSLYGDIYKYIEQRNKEDYHYIKSFKTRTFSDNILFATSAHLSNIQLCYALGDFIDMAAKIQASALINGILTRGGITIGNICINEYLAYGKGLLEAIDLEENVANNPRIVIHDCLEKKCSEYYKSNSYTKKDIDNFRYIDFYSYAVRTASLLEQCTNSLEALTKEKCGNNKVISKLNWLINQHNEYIEKVFKNEIIHFDTKYFDDSTKEKYRIIKPVVMNSISN